MHFAREVADYVIFLKDGVLLEQGPPEQLFDHPQHPATRDYLSRVDAR
jgi:polar amino acid transport system ATP-binding protein